MDLETKFKRPAICVGVKFVRLARPGSFSSLQNANKRSSFLPYTTMNNKHIRVNELRSRSHSQPRPDEKTVHQNQRGRMEVNITSWFSQAKA